METLPSRSESHVAHNSLFHHPGRCARHLIKTRSTQITGKGPGFAFHLCGRSHREGLGGFRRNEKVQNAAQYDHAPCFHGCLFNADCSPMGSHTVLSLLFVRWEIKPESLGSPKGYETGGTAAQCHHRLCSHYCLRGRKPNRGDPGSFLAELGQSILQPSSSTTACQAGRKNKQALGSFGRHERVRGPM